METMSTITSRRSIRSYTGEGISDSDLQTVLKAANAAPVGMGKYENAHLSVIQDPKLLREIEASAAEALGRPDASIFYGAPTYIVVSAKPYGDALGNIDYANTGIIVHNMALAATDLGVGSCYIWGGTMALVANPALVARLNLPEGFVPCGGIVLGVSDETYAPREIPQRIGTNYVG